MPSMPRPSGPRAMKKGRDIAFSILGVPPNMRKQKMSNREKEIDSRLIYEDTKRVR
jgi:hypothetical protein